MTEWQKVAFFAQIRQDAEDAYWKAELAEAAKSSHNREYWIGRAHGIDSVRYWFVAAFMEK